MKAYVLRISLDGSSPLIWRRVIMPAGATFNRLHDVIQNVTNFKSGYPYGDYHLFEFDLSEENIMVTNNEEAFEEQDFYWENKSEFDDRLQNMPSNVLVFERNLQERFRKKVKWPDRMKIDDYLEKHKSIRYIYDFGDGWFFTIALEDIVEDYYFGFPALLDGAQTAPPEDAGGLGGFMDFLEAYRDPKHPEHKEMLRWAKEQGYREYDPARINKSLRHIKYKKTQWDKVDHVNYKIISDKYIKF